MTFSGLGFVGVFFISRPRCLPAIGYHCDFRSAENGLFSVLLAVVGSLTMLDLVVMSSSRAEEFS